MASAVCFDTRVVLLGQYEAPRGYCLLEVGGVVDPSSEVLSGKDLGTRWRPGKAAFEG